MCLCECVMIVQGNISCTSSQHILKLKFIIHNLENSRKVIYSQLNEHLCSYNIHFHIINLATERITALTTLTNEIITGLNKGLATVLHSFQQSINTLNLVR